VKLVVFGAAGRLGRILVDKAIAQGHEVTAVARNPAAVAPRAGLTICRGDVASVANVQQCISGQDAIVSAIGHRDRRAPDIYPIAAEHYLQAMERTGVRRIIVMSAFIAESEARTGFLFRRVVLPVVFRRVWDALEAADRRYRQSELEWTQVRASRLTDESRGGRYRSGVGLRGNFWSRIGRADVADFILDELHRRAYVRQCPDLLY
jgi:putative NADH-flavin reductase